MGVVTYMLSLFNYFLLFKNPIYYSINFNYKIMKGELS
jgi:hypothetical protein